MISINVKREEIMQGVFLNYLKSNKFKTSCISISLLTQLKRETASLNALIPAVLHRGTASYPTMEALSARCDELYGTIVEPQCRRTGEVQSIGFIASFPENSWLPKGENILRDVSALLAELLLSPATRGGLLLQSYVESEKEKLIDLIKGRVNEKRSYALTRCIQEMCCFEDIAVTKFGSVEDCESINYKKLTKQYHEVLQTSPIEIFYSGRESFNTVSQLLQEAFLTLPRGGIDYEIGTEIRMNSVEENPRYFEERLDVTQGKLVLGFRLGEFMENPDYAVLTVFNAVYGSGVTSKLFVNVREKLSLCYYASSIADFHKGLLLVSSGIDFAKYDAAKNEILHQLDEVKCGTISDNELEYAKAGIKSDLKAMADSQFETEQFYFSNIIDGLDITPEELSEAVDKVTKEDVSALAAGLELDLIYFLRGEENNDDEN